MALSEPINPGGTRAQSCGRCPELDEEVRRLTAENEALLDRLKALEDALRSYRNYHDAAQAKPDYDYQVCKCRQCQKAETALAAREEKP